MSAAPKDGCASGCGGCLLVLLIAGLFVAGPTGWIVVVALLGIAWLLSLNQESPLKSRHHRPLAPPAPAPPPPEHRNPFPQANDDPELERLLEEARQAIDETR